MGPGIDQILNLCAVGGGRQDAYRSSRRAHRSKPSADVMVLTINLLVTHRAVRLAAQGLVGR